MANVVSVIIVDDHAVLRAGLRALLQKEPDIHVVGEAPDGRAATKLVRELRPDVALMDLWMPEMNGIDATRHAIEAKHDLKVIGLSAANDERSAVQMIRAGASGFLAKESAYEEVVAAIRTVVSGKQYFSLKTMSAFTSFNSIGGNAAVSSFEALSPREREVLQLIAEGRATKQMAVSLNISVKTAETHRRNLMEKLGIESVAGLTKYAIREGLTTPHL